MDPFCDHIGGEKDLVIIHGNIHEFVGLKWCTKCKRILKDVVKEIIP